MAGDAANALFYREQSGGAARSHAIGTDGAGWELKQISKNKGRKNAGARLKRIEMNS